MPLLRIDGRWWHREDVAVPPPAATPGSVPAAEQEEGPAGPRIDGRVSMDGEE